MSNSGRISYLLIFMTILFSTASCTEDLDVVGSGIPVPVVYCLLNPNDTVNYATLTKSFTGEESALEMAKDTDLRYYENADIYLEIITESGWPVKYAPFTKIPGPTKNPGIFAESPNQIYYLNVPVKAYLAEGYTIRLIVNIPDEQTYCSASQVFYPEPQILLPSPSRQTKMNLYHGETQQIKWEDKFGSACYQLYFG